jgi:hypothetical protein
METMKKVVSMLVAICLYHTVPAQVVIALLFGEKLNTGKLEFGLVVSPALTAISELESEQKPVLNLSLYFNVLPDKKIFLHIEAIGKGSWGAKGIAPYPTGNDSLDRLFATGSVQRNIQAFGLCLLGRYRITQLFFAEAGVQTNLRLKSKDVFKAKINNNELEYRIKTTDHITPLDFGITGGLFYKFRKDRRSMGIGIRYYNGLTDTHKSLEGNQANAAWLLNLTIPIGAGKTDSAKTR